MIYSRLQQLAKEVEQYSTFGDVLVKVKSSAKVLCGVMNLPTQSQRYNKKESGLFTAVETVATCPNKMNNENCKANHFGNSESMEVSGAIEIFQCSESLNGLRYTKCFGVGDARAYKAVNEMQPYGDIGIEKLECAFYVEKMDGDSITSYKTI
ncbi:hypothetical protein TNCV_4080741 [Trichonephila clavipes]|nr:hypothetical protein TNCV_4080741 [Trichonephila clavipes]